MRHQRASVLLLIPLVSLLQSGVEATPQLTHCLFIVMREEVSEEQEEAAEEVELGRGLDGAVVSGMKLG